MQSKDIPRFHTATANPVLHNAEFCARKLGPRWRALNATDGQPTTSDLLSMNFVDKSRKSLGSEGFCKCEAATIGQKPPASRNPVLPSTT
jgi:hypothetical protein